MAQLDLFPEAPDPRTAQRTRAEGMRTAAKAMAEDLQRTRQATFNPQTGQGDMFGKNPAMRGGMDRTATSAGAPPQRPAVDLNRQPRSISGATFPVEPGNARAPRAPQAVPGAAPQPSAAPRPAGFGDPLDFKTPGVAPGQRAPLDGWKGKLGLKTDALKTLSSGKIGPVAGPAGLAVAAYPESKAIMDVAQNPNSSVADVGAQAGQGMSRLATAGLGTVAGAKMGAMAAPFLGPFAPAGPALGAVAGGAYGYWAGDKFIEGARQLAGSDPRSPAAQQGVETPVAKALAPITLGAPQAAAAAPAAAPASVFDVQSGRGRVNPPTVGQGPAPVQAQYENPNGTIIKDGNSYRGVGDIKFGADIRTPTGGLRNGYGVSVVGGGTGGRSVQEIEANTRRIEAENSGLRREIDAYGRINASGKIGSGEGMLSSQELRARNQEGNEMKLPYTERMAREKNATDLAVADKREAGDTLRTGMSTDTQRETNAATNATTLRAEQIRAGVDRNGRAVKVAQSAEDRQFVANAYQAAKGDPRRMAEILTSAGRLDLAKDAAGVGQQYQGMDKADDETADSRRAATAKLFRPEFVRKVKDSNGNTREEFDEVGAERAAGILETLTGGKFNSLPKEEQSKRKLQASLLARVYGKVSGGEETGIASMFNGPRDRSEVMPDLRGGKLSQAGFVRGATTRNLASGEYELALPDGRGGFKNINVGELSDQELGLLTEMMNAGGVNDARGLPKR